VGRKGKGEGTVKKHLMVVILCLISFLGGWFFHYLYPTSKPSLGVREFQRWELKKKLKLAEGKFSEITVIEEKDMGSYTVRLLRFLWQGFSFDAYLLIPKKKAEKVAAILALHGHKTTKDDVVGIKRSRFNVDFGRRLVESGFCVLVPDIIFSEDFDVEDHVALNLIMSGGHITGLRLSYLQSLLDYLCSLPFVDSKKVGCVGWSMGGGLALYLAAVDKRLKVVEISNYFGTYRGTFMRKRRSIDNYIPDILSFGEMADVACLIAPRPLLIEGGKRDPEFPKEAFMQGVKALKNCYKGHEERLTWQLMPGGHRFEGKGIEEWFKKWL